LRELVMSLVCPFGVYKERSRKTLMLLLLLLLLLLSIDSSTNPKTLFADFKPELEWDLGRRVTWQELRSWPPAPATAAAQQALTHSQSQVASGYVR